MKYRPPRTVIGWDTVHSLGTVPGGKATRRRAESRQARSGHCSEQKPRASARHPPGGATCVGTKHRRVAVQPVAHERCRSVVRQAAGTAFHASAQSNAPHAERGHVHAGRSAAAVEREVGRASSRPARPGARWRSTRGQGSGWAGCLCLGPRFVEENGKLW